MSNDDRLGTQAGRDQAGTLMTPQACAIAGFTLAALALTGQGVWNGFAQSFFGSSFAPSSVGAVLATGFLVTLVVQGGAVLLVRPALAAPAGRDDWPGHLARAAVLLAVVGGVFSLLALVSSLVVNTR